jgi:hypothetical protein
MGYAQFNACLDPLLTVAGAGITTVVSSALRGSSPSKQRTAC